MFITSRNFSQLRELISLADAERNNPEVILIGCRKHPEMIRCDLAPKFYPVLSSLRLLDLPDWAVVATGAGAEPSA